MASGEHLVMGKVHAVIDDTMREFIDGQTVFFVGSAPLDPAGHVNISPKGLDTFRILGPTSVAYLDLTGSGVETIAHVKENRRIVLMFCAFQGRPNILRLHGLGTVIEPHQAKFSELLGQFPAYEGMRAIIVVEVTRISTSCGMGLPLLRYEGEREQLPAWHRTKGTEGLKAYCQEKNRRSIDDLPGLSA
jgi:hypothetical protein